MSKGIDKVSDALNMRVARRRINVALRKLNCKPSWQKDGKDSVVRFDYQNGHFGIRITPDESYAHLFYLFVYSTSLEDLDAVRVMCNKCNTNTRNCRMVYTTDNKKGEIDIHIFAGLLLSDSNLRETLATNMRRMFIWQGTFANNFEDLLLDKYHNKVDKEKKNAEFDYAMSLVKEQEIMHQATKTESWRSEISETFTMKRLLNSALDINNFLPMSLAIIRNGKAVNVPADNIKDYDISKVLIGEDEKTLRDASATLKFIDKEYPEKERCMQLHFQAENETDDAIYYRVTLTMIPLAADTDITIGSEGNTAKVSSVLLARDKMSPKQRLDKFNYEWKEAMAKLNNGGINSLTKDEMLLVNCLDKNNAFNYYQGIKLYYAHRYIEALPYLVTCYNRMKLDHGSLTTEQNENICNIAYYIGFIYNELGLYDKAYYYLQLLEPLHYVLYTEELINNLVNSHDPRAMGMIDGLISFLNMSANINAGGGDGDDEEDGMGSNEELSEFSSFLRRRKVYLLIEAEQYDEAEKLLRNMLDEPENFDFAKHELTFLQEQKQKGDEE